LNSIFPFIVFIFIGIGISLFFKFWQRPKGSKSSYKTEDQFIFLFYVLIFASNLTVHLFSFSILDPNHAHFGLVSSVTIVSFLMIFLMSVRLYGLGLKGGGAGGSKKPIFEKKDPRWIKGVFLVLVVIGALYVIEEVIKISISNFPSHDLSGLEKMNQNVIGIRIFSIIVMCTSLVQMTKNRKTYY
jgi:hypothetical protein